MGQRMFVAVVPPEPIRDELADFLDAREGMRWTSPEQWHITLAFCASVPEHRIDELGERLAHKMAKVPAFPATLAEAGAFPNPARAVVLWLGVHTTAEELSRMSAKARAAASAVGAEPDGKRFRPHLTLARPRRPIEATRWLRILETFRSSTWTVEEVELVASHLGEGPSGRPRYETVATVPLREPVDA